MVIRGPQLIRPAKQIWRVFVVIVMCALMQVAIADDKRDESSTDKKPAHDAAENSLREIKIRRLKPADPESTETMLAELRFDPPGKSRT